jgi:hypothetical protein
MNQLTAQKQRDVVAVDAAQVPASKKPANRWKQFRMLCLKADQILWGYERLNEIQEQLEQREPGEPLPHAPDVLLTDEGKAKIAWVRQMLSDIDRDDYYEQDDAGDRVLKKKIIKERLALTIGAVHVGGPKTPEAFAEILLAHVYDAEVSYPVLESACRDIEQNKKFLQVTSEVLDVIREHRLKWDKRLDALEYVEGWTPEVQETLDEARASFAIERAEAKVKEAEGNLTEATYRLNRRCSYAVDAQSKVREAYQAVERAMADIDREQSSVIMAAAKLCEAKEALAALTNNTSDSGG